MGNGACWSSNDPVRSLACSFAATKPERCAPLNSKSKREPVASSTRWKAGRSPDARCNYTHFRGTAWPWARSREGSLATALLSTQRHAFLLFLQYYLDVFLFGIQAALSTISSLPVLISITRPFTGILGKKGLLRITLTTWRTLTWTSLNAPSQRRRPCTSANFSCSINL